MVPGGQLTLTSIILRDSIRTIFLVSLETPMFLYNGNGMHLFSRTPITSIYFTEVHPIVITIFTFSCPVENRQSMKVGTRSGFCSATLLCTTSCHSPVGNNIFKGIGKSVLEDIVDGCIPFRRLITSFNVTCMGKRPSSP